MPKHVKVYERSDLNAAIEAKGLEADDLVSYEPDNQMGQQRFKVVQAANGKKSLRLIWDAEMGNLNHNNSNSNSNNNRNHYTSNDDMNISNNESPSMGGARRRAKKTRRNKKSLRRNKKSLRRAKKTRRNKKSLRRTRRAH